MVQKMPFKAYRASLGMTQDDVAKLLEINRSTYAKWEKFESYPDAIQLIKLSEIFRCSLDSFYFPIKTSFKLANHSNQ